MARRLGTGEEEVRRLRDPLRDGTIDDVDTALRALGKQIVIVIETV